MPARDWRGISKKEKNAAWRKAVEREVKKQTPLPGNRCRKRGCTGTLKKRVNGLFQGRFTYDLPACSKCGRSYTNAWKEKVPPFGQQEFLDSLREKCTV